MNDDIIDFQFNSDIAEGNDTVRLSFYSSIGFFIEIAQMFEFNLRKLICFERSVKEIERGDITKENVEQICAKYDKYYDDTYLKSPKMTLGKLIRESKIDSSIPEDFFTFLAELNRFRVSLVHKIFQNNIITHFFTSADNVREYTKTRIIPITNQAIAMNRTIIHIINLYREDLHKYKVQVGIPLPN